MTSDRDDGQLRRASRARNRRERWNRRRAEPRARRGRRGAGAALRVERRGRERAGRRDRGGGGPHADARCRSGRRRTRPSELVAEVERELGPVDVLAANAGLSRPGAWEDIDAEAFDETHRSQPASALPAGPPRAAGHARARLRPHPLHLVRRRAHRRHRRTSLCVVQGRPTRPDPFPCVARRGRRRDGQRDRPGADRGHRHAARGPRRADARRCRSGGSASLRRWPTSPSRCCATATSPARS